MGATNFYVTGKGKTVEQAFDALVVEARYLYGHGGYTGTIAEKHGYVEMAPPAGLTPEQFASAAEGYDDNPGVTLHPTVIKARRIFDDKWGPALAIPKEPGEWIFVGLASE